DLEAFADLTEAVRIRYADVVEDELARIRRAQPELAVQRLAPVGVAIPLQNERRDSLGLLRGIALREHERELRDRSVRDPHLSSADHPRVAVALRGRSELRRIASDLGLGEPEAADHLALAERGKPALLLLLCAEFEDRHLHERDLD